MTDQTVSAVHTNAIAEEAARAAPATPMEEVETLTQHYAEARDQLTDIVTGVQQQIERITRAATTDIKTHVRAVAEAHDRLQTAVGEHTELWAGKRRTVVIAGVRVGMRKGKGRIVWDDADQVVRLIRKTFPDAAEAMIRIKEEPISSSLENLTAAELKSIACKVSDTEDQIVIKPTDSQVDKLVAALLRDAERIEREDAA